MQSAQRGLGDCCETAADNLAARHLGRLSQRDLLEVPCYQEAWLTKAGSTAIADILQAEPGLRPHCLWGPDRIQAAAGLVGILAHLCSTRQSN